MSDDNPHKYSKDRDKSKDIEVQPNVAPDAVDLFEWLTKLYSPSDELPLKIEVRQVFGRGCSLMGEGIIHLHLQKPDKQETNEELTALANTIVQKAQHDCNEIGKVQRYGVFVYHPKKADKWYDRHLLRLNPRDGSVAGSELLEEGGDGGKGRLYEQELQHMQFRHQQFGDANANILDHLQARLEKVESSNDRYGERLAVMAEKFTAGYEKLVDQFVKMMSATEQALSQADNRRLAAEMQSFKMEMLRKGASMVESLAPAALNAAIGQKALPERSPIAVAVEAFLNGLDEQQRTKAFGALGPDGRLAQKGIFSIPQFELFVAIAEGKAPPEKIDDFFEGPLTVTQEQFVQAMTVFRPEQFAGVASIGMQRRAEREAAKAKAS